DAQREAARAVRKAAAAARRAAGDPDDEDDEADAADEDGDKDEDADGAGQKETSTPAPKPRRSIAILGFKNLSGNPKADYLSTAFAEMLATELMAGEEIRTVPAEIVGRARKQLNLVEADSYAPDTLASIRQLVDCDYVVTGSFIVLGDGGRVRMDLKLQDTRSGETVASTAQQGTQDDLGQ